MLKPGPATPGFKRAGAAALPQQRSLRGTIVATTLPCLPSSAPPVRSWAVAASPPEVEVVEVEVALDALTDSSRQTRVQIVVDDESVFTEESLLQEEQLPALMAGLDAEELRAEAKSSVEDGGAVDQALAEASSAQAAGSSATGPILPTPVMPVDLPTAAVEADAQPSALPQPPPPVAAADTTAPPAVPAPPAPEPEAATPAPAPAPAPARTPLRAPEVHLPLPLFRRGPGAAPQPATPRPFPPPFDAQRVSEALLGEPTIGPIFDDLFRLSRMKRFSRGTNGPSATADGLSQDDGQAAVATQDAADGAANSGPLLYKPVFERPPGSPDPSRLPLLVYLPGMDGTGLAAYRQFPGLAARFDLRGVFLPPDDRTPFAGLVDELAEQLTAEATGLDPSRPVYLLGESFGGLLALELAQRLNFVDRLVLVNPATSFLRSPWPALGPLLPALPPELYRLLPVALSPILSNPLSMALWATSPADPPQQQAVDLLYGLLELLPELSSLRTVLPPDTLAWRLELLRQGAEQVNPSVGKVRQRTLLLCGESDLVIPSASEGPRLQRLLPRCVLRPVPGGSHAMLQQSDTDLMAMLQAEDFYVSRRRLTRPNTPPPSSTATRTTRTTKPAPGGANFGTAGPLELPTPGEVRRALDQGGLSGLRRLVSPVYLSTQPGSGRVQLGLDALPAPGSGPVLFVGNHQLFAPDMPLMVAHFLEERGQLLRGLAHPTALGMRQPSQGDPGSQAVGAADSARFGGFLETFGAVPVSGRNLHELLAGGEAALLYPGGVREALKLRDEKYALIWPRKAEFVRMACKFGATIIPFAGVGAEDSVQLLADRRDLLATPLLGDWLRGQQQSMVLARRGVSASEDVEESFVPPLVSFGAPSRFYFLFGEPIRTDPRDASDRAVVEALYGRVRSELEGCLGYLLRKRDQDPYKDLVPRLLYEASWGGRRQAPTFRP